jgi:hypothetical protein
MATDSVLLKHVVPAAGTLVAMAMFVAPLKAVLAVRRSRALGVRRGAATGARGAARVARRRRGRSATPRRPARPARAFVP